MGRASIPAGAPSSNDIEKPSVGPIRRITRNPTQVISQSKNLRHKEYGRPSVDCPLETGDAAATLTPPLYRPPPSVERTLLSAAFDLVRNGSGRLARQLLKKVRQSGDVASNISTATLCRDRVCYVSGCRQTGEKWTGKPALPEIADQDHVAAFAAA